MQKPDEQIDGFSLRNILISANQLLEPEIYQAALQTAGLERFKVAPPSASPEKVATAKELADFWRAIYNGVAFPTFKLFERNVGGEIAQMTQQVGPIVALRTQLLVLPRSQRLAETVSQTSRAVNLNGVQTSYQPYQDGFLLYFDTCPFICDSVQTAEPLCHVYEFMFLKLLKWLSKLPLISNEIECVAMGHAQCLYYFREAR